MPDYSILDQPFLLANLFFPRRDYKPGPAVSFDFDIPVDNQVHINCRFYPADLVNPCILYFHGNGEVVSDYDHIASFYNSRHLNLLVVDYRGYGSSTGVPSFQHMINDARVLFMVTSRELERRGYSSQIYIMGRSLGSSSALDLVSFFAGHVKGLIIESGFASVSRLVRHLRIPATSLDSFEADCVQLVSSINTPALIIHGEADELVPIEEGRIIYETLGSVDKFFLSVPYAGHNNIISTNINLYFDAIANFIYSYE